MRPAFRVLASASLFLAVGLLTSRSQVNVTVDATKPIRVVDNRQFGVNAPFWDSTFTNATTTDTLTEMGTQFMRYGGGSATDEYNWMSNTDLVSGETWAFNIDLFAVKAKALGNQGIITVNYGSGTATGSPDSAAAYVQYANVTNHYGFKYWEIGNECYGTWEYDTNTPAHDGLTYATRAAAYIQAMKAMDPSIKIGIVADASEDSYIEATAVPVTNPVTGVSHSGWTPIVLTQLKALGVYPDFLIYHMYAQNAGQENDALLLQVSPTVWAMAAANLRMQLNDYLGMATASGIELLVTENNSVSTSPGKQSVSLVNGLYLADSTACLMQTEFNSLVWWDLHNGQALNSSTAPINVSSSLYGWRIYGDYGVENQATNDRYPTFYVEKLLSHYARGGDTVITTSSDNPLLSAYAVTRTNGSLSILVINKSPTVTYSVAFGITGFTPQGNETLYSYGIPQDNNAMPGSTGSPDIVVSTATGAAGSFSASFAPYSVTVLNLQGPTAAPASARQPNSQTVATGRTATFSFPATGGPTPTFQWYLNGTAVAGATNSTLVVNGATAADAGTYTCTATNASGALTSSGATLTVVATSDPGRLVNISARAQVGTDSNIIFGGFAIGPQGLSGTDTVLIRASGPALAAFGVGGTLPDPELQLFNSADTAIAGDLNMGWGGSAAIAAAASSVGAFAWTSSTSLDAALLVSLAPGAYTAQVSGASRDTGDALMEVYDDTPAARYTVSDPRLVNLSARVDVQSGAANALFVGFVIKGATSMTVLIRASGPALAAFGVAGTLPDPQLSLQSAGTVLATNAGWGGDTAIAATAASVGAFKWSSAGSADSALLVTLPPGAYNAVVSGVSGDAGAALVEVYEVQ